MKHYILFLFLSYSLIGVAQSELREINDLSRDMHRANSGAPDPNIEGTPYWNTEFEKGEILLSDQGIYKNVMMRYDAFNDVIETQQNDQVFRFSTPEKLVYATMGKDTLYYLPFYRSKKQLKSYFYIVSKGKLSLYVKHSKSFKPAQEPIGFQDAIPASYNKAADQYYFKLSDNELVAINSKKDMIAFFNDKTMAAFIKKNKVTPRKEDKLKALVEFYNSK